MASPGFVVEQDHKFHVHWHRFFAQKVVFELRTTPRHTLMTQSHTLALQAADCDAVSQLIVEPVRDSESPMCAWAGKPVIW